MIIYKPRWENRLILALNRAITDVVAAPSHKVKLAISGLIYRHNRSGFMLDREVYYNFRHDGAEAFNHYNLKNPSTTKITRSGTVTFVPNSHVTFNGPSGYYNTNKALGIDAIYSRLHNSHHLGFKNFAAYMFGINVSGAGYTMLDGLGIRLHCASTEYDAPPSFPWGGAENDVAIGRIDANTIFSTKNGVRDATMAQPDNGFSLAGIALFIGCRNANGAADGSVGLQIKYYSNGEVTTAARDLQVYNAETEFQAALAALP